MKVTALRMNMLITFVMACSLAGAGCKGARRQEPVNSVLSFFSEKDFNQFFPRHSRFFTYTAFAKAVREMAAIQVTIERRGEWMYRITRTDKITGQSAVVREDRDWDEDWAGKQPYTITKLNYNDFCGNNNQAVNKKEAAAFFAHIAHETRDGDDGKFDDGLMLKEELNTGLPYTNPNTVYPAVTGEKYYGRGPIQLSYNGNYGLASACILGDKDILLKNPDLVSSEPVLSFKTALYFWMTPEGRKPSAHAAITGQWKPSAAEIKSGYSAGFGMTINIVNGAMECNKGEEQTGMKDRIGFYNYFLKLLGTEDKSGTCSCGKMAPF